VNAFAGNPANGYIPTLNAVSGSVLDLIGNTSLLELTKLTTGLKARVFVKTEFMNPSGSIKDRMVCCAIQGAERRGLLKVGDTLVEASSGNTGVALAMLSAVKGYKAVIVVPDTTSRVKVEMMERYGAEIVYTPSELGVRATVMKASQVAEERKAFLLDQFRNPDNVKAHNITGREILRQAGKVDVFVAGIGTGGTLIGIAEVLKEANPETRIIAVEPVNASAFYNLFYGTDLPLGSGIPHRIEGIGESFVPEIISENVGQVDGVILIEEEDAFEMMKKLATEEGLYVGVSSGANVWSSIKLAEEIDAEKNIVTVLPDSGQRYVNIKTCKADKI
jgi:cysteine synthase A